MKTATEIMMEKNAEDNRYRQYAQDIIHDLREAGFIPNFCGRAAEAHLATRFARSKVRIITDQDREFTREYLVDKLIGHG